MAHPNHCMACRLAVRAAARGAAAAGGACAAAPLLQAALLQLVAGEPPVDALFSPDNYDGCLAGVLTPLSQTEAV